MSKYIKLEDIETLITACEWRMTLAKERHGEGFVDYSKQVLDVDELTKRLSNLPTIEVSEDCISRAWVQNKLTEYVKDYAPGGVIRSKPDYEPEADMIDRLISKLPPSDREQERRILSRIKNRCKCRNECEDCWYNESKDPDTRACVLSGVPEKWLI